MATAVNFKATKKILCHVLMNCAPVSRVRVELGYRLSHERTWQIEHGTENNFVHRANRKSMKCNFPQHLSLPDVYKNIHKTFSMSHHLIFCSSEH